MGPTSTILALRFWTWLYCEVGKDGVIGYSVHCIGLSDLNDCIEHCITHIICLGNAYERAFHDQNQ